MTCVCELGQLESELKELAQSTVWRQVGARCSFWQRCNDLMKRYQVPAAAATSFFQVFLLSDKIINLLIINGILI